MQGQGQDSVQLARYVFIALFLLSVGIFLIDRGQNRIFGGTQIGAESAASPAMNILSKPIRAIEGMFEGAQDRQRALEENKSLRAELMLLRDAKLQSELMAIKLERLEEILDASDMIGIPEERIAARAISEIKGPFVRSTLINAGAKQGVKKGHPVMTVNGLYGHVLRAGPNVSRVLQLSDLNSRISVMSVRSEARAILAGNNTELPVLAFVNSEADWREGDLVVTSGDDGVLPQGLPVGVLKQTAPDEFAVELGTSGFRTDWVWVSPYQPITGADVEKEPGLPADEIVMEQAEEIEAPVAPDGGQ